MNNFAELSGGEGAAFLVRWRGRQEGPYPASLIGDKLAASEIGLLHEILHKGQWIAIRDFIAEREAILRSERQALEERERIESDQRARSNQRQTQSHDELLAEERRNETLLKLAAENRGGVAWRPSGQKDMRLVYGIIIAIILLAGIGAYTSIQIKAQAAAAEAARIQAEQQAEAIKAAAKAQQNAEMIKAGASVLNTVIDGVVEANKPVPAVIINSH